jgi:diguanylate cyclase (GGDEF)-like protein
MSAPEHPSHDSFDLIHEDHGWTIPRPEPDAGADSPAPAGDFTVVGPATRPSRLLLVDDSDGCRRLVRHWLRDLPARVAEASTIPHALRLAESHPPDLILLDSELPGIAWQNALHRLQTTPSTRDLPVILLAGSARHDRIAAGIDLGAVDGLLKPFHRSELRARVRAALRVKKRHDQLQRKATSDALTDLGNRHGLDLRLREAVAQSARANAPISVWLADLDHFKRINDLHGHRVGDAVLRWAAGILRKVVRAGDFAGRYGGEEFVVVSPRCDARTALAMAERFREELKRWPPPGLPTPDRLTVSAGVVTTQPGRFVHQDELLHSADACLYAAKEAGRDCSWLWNESTGAPIPGRARRREAL